MLSIGVVAPAGGALLCAALLPGKHWESPPFHSSVQALGSIAALTVAALFILVGGPRRREPGLALYQVGPRALLTSCAFLAMGLLDGVNACTRPGMASVWLHSAAAFWGGLFLALIWLPSRPLSDRARRWLPAVAAVGATVVGLLPHYLPEVLPTVVRQGDYTRAGRGLNLVGGLLFLAASWRFVLQYLASRLRDDWCLAVVCLLLAMSGFLSELSTLWDAQWWLWHLCRVAAYALAFWSLLVAYRRNQGELGEANRSLQTTIVDLKQTETELRTAASVFEAMVDGAAITDMQGVIVDVNMATATQHGYEKKELIGTTPADLLLAERERPRFAEHADQCLAGEPVTNCEYLARRKDGTEFPVVISLSAMISPEGRPTGVVAVHKDITEIRRAEQERRAAQDFQRRILHTAATAVFTVDPEQIITTVNRELCDLTGFAEAEVVGRHCSILRGEPCQTRCGLYSPERTEPIFRKQCAIRTKDDRRLSIFKNADLIHDEAGRITGGIESFIDVTQLVEAREVAEETSNQLEQAVAHANNMAAEAEMANAAKSEFLANMSHEIRTPMNGVIGMTGLLLDTDLTPEQRQYADTAGNSAESLLGLINDILDFSKIEAGKLELEALDFDLRTTLEDFGDALAMRAHDSGLEFNCLIPPDVPSRLRGDPGRLRQVLTNLAGNAVKFTEEGEIAIVAEVTSEHEERVTIRFSVRDTGIGIPKKHQEALFQAFTQADGSTSRKYGGTGLGLTISKQLAEMMGGEIGVESVEGEGSTFWYTTVFEKPSSDAHPAVATAVGMPAEMKDVRVLAVDDNSTNRLVVGGMLEAWGFRHDEVSDGQTALHRLAVGATEGDPYRAAILDMRMPDMTGEELAVRVKADPSLAATRLIVMTSFGSRGDAARLSKAGIDGYLPKPVKQSALHDGLAAVLAKTTPEEATGRRPLVTRHTIAESRRAGVRILLAEDNITNQQVALAILKKLGYRADAVADGEEALKALESIPYDLVLMDCQMPAMDGFEATAAIRSPESSVHDHRVPIVAMTAHAMKGDREKCLAAGMDGYVAKPVRPQELAEAIERCLSLQETTSPATTPANPPATDIYDAAVLLDTLDGEEELVRTIIDGFLEDIPCQIDTLKAALVQGDAPVVRRQAHTIKGASANVGAEVLRQTAYEVEKAGESGDLGKAASLTPEIDKQFAVLRNAIQQRELTVVEA